MECPWNQLVLIFFFGLLHSHKNVESASPTALFVFGDSYVDTGNLPKTLGSWQPPYGVTFPGKPSGRHSDGKVLTDFVASTFQIPTPVAYNERDSNSSLLHFGMNFATGGTGVFNTWAGLPNASIQIDHLQELIDNGTYSPSNFTSSLVLFSVSGNDYGYYLLQQKSPQGLSSLVQSVNRQLSDDLVRLYNIGFRRFAVTNMAPMGCLPAVTIQNSYTRCNSTLNTLAIYHNSLLLGRLQMLRFSRADATFVLLDQYSDSLTIIRNPNLYGNLQEPLKPCCTGWCGYKDQAGKPVFSVCSHPESHFFWDIVHPTQAAWEALMTLFEPPLRTFQI